MAVAAIAALGTASEIGTTPADILAQDESLENPLAAAGSASLFALLAGVVGFTRSSATAPRPAGLRARDVS